MIMAFGRAQAGCLEECALIWIHLLIPHDWIQVTYFGQECHLVVRSSQCIVSGGTEYLAHPILEDSCFDHLLKVVFSRAHHCEGITFPL